MNILAVLLVLSSHVFATNSEAIRKLITKNMDQVQACYNQYLNEKNREGDAKGAVGKLTISWEIDKEGKAANFKELKSSFTDKHVFSCVAGKMATWTFPPSHPKPVTAVKFPFVFDYKK